MREAVRHLRHQALSAGSAGCPLDQAQLTDQEKIAVVLQAAALLAQLEHGGFFLALGWEGSCIGPDLLLRVGQIQEGRPLELAQNALQRLLARLFRSQGPIAGRGEARRVARHLWHRWQQSLAPLSADAAVVETLELAPFLWLPAFSSARTALVAEHGTGENRHLWVVGRGEARRRLLAQGRTFEQAAALMAGTTAQELWEGWDKAADPWQLMAQGQWRRAAIAWRQRGTSTRAEVLAQTRCWFALGQYSSTLTLLKGHHTTEARLLRAWCQLYLGELNAAQNTVRRLAETELSAAEQVALAAVAIRVSAAHGQYDEGRDWAAQALGKSHGRWRCAACLLAAEAAWDRDDAQAMETYLEAGHEALRDPELAWRWHQVRGLRSMAAGDGAGAVEQIGRALQLRRRQLLQAEAARLWNDLAVARALADDLPAAERACRHALRLFNTCEGPGRSTLALYNLAEVRLRRGHTVGVENVLAASTAENRRAGNVRGLVRDLELWIRFELTQGRPAAALARCTEALQGLGEERIRGRAEVLDVLAARAHGWLGRPEQARACLARVREPAVRELEPEERPALWAHAGLPDQACAAAADTPWARLWPALLSDAVPPHELWESLATLEPFRAARLVFDCEKVRPGVVPPHWARRAIAIFTDLGAVALADQLENRSLTPWRALERYLENSSRATAIADLLQQSGYVDVLLTFIPQDGHPRVLCSGTGGSAELAATLRNGRLLLRSSTVDAPLKTLFHLLQRDLNHALLEPEKGQEEPRMPAPGGIMGQSVSLKSALSRLDRLSAGELPVLLLGESGSGKELFARRVHRVSRRVDKPYLVVNCAALSETLILSDLFGHIRGAFTGADRDHQGVFESARGGTLFLDEIGDLPAIAQGQLLRVLQEGEIRRLGESFTRKVDVRIIAATHRDLEAMVHAGTFRQDLFFRLKVAMVRLPPLRERGSDVLSLADHFLAQRRATSGTPLRLAPAAKSRLLSYHWPGNVRELRNVLEVAAALAEGPEIQPEQLDLPTVSGRGETARETQGDYHQQVEAFRKRLVSEVLHQVAGNRSEAARRLGLSRQALSYLVRQLGVT